MTKLLEEKPHSLLDAMIANQDVEEAVRGANKRLQAEGRANMNSDRVTSEDIEVWPKDLKIMVEQGKYN